MDGTELKRFDSPDGTRTSGKGRFEVVRIGATAVGRASYGAGWTWSEHAGSAAGDAPYVSLQLMEADDYAPGASGAADR